MDYLSHWNLRRKPFENNRDNLFFYPGREHVEALERLSYLVRDGNMCFGLLTGEIGAGKTMVANQLKHRLNEDPRYLTVHLPNGNMEFTDLLREMLHNIETRGGGRYRRGPRVDETKYQLVSRFRDILENKVARLGRLLVVLIDEAQDLGEEAIVELKNLTNIGTSEQNYITIILAGQPELSGMVRALPQINQRVGLRYHLPCLSREGVGEYLEYRLEAAGCTQRQVFDAEAKNEIYEVTNGVPREINRLCKLALDRTFSMGQANVTATVVRSIAADIYHQDAMV